MPTTKYGRKRYARKSSTKRAKRVVKKRSVRKKNATGQDTMTKTFKMSSVLTPGQGGTVTNYINQFFTLKPSASSTQVSWNYNSEVRCYRALYDRFRVTKMTAKIIPRANVTTSGQVGGTGYNNSANVYYTMVDRDSDVKGTIAQMKRLKSTKCHSQLKGCKLSYAVKYPKGIWLDTATDMDLTSCSAAVLELYKQIGVFGGITLYGNDFPENDGRVANKIWAEVELTYTLTFETYNPAQIQWDPEADTLTLLGTCDARTSENPLQELPFISTDGGDFNLADSETPIAGVVLVQQV